MKKYLFRVPALLILTLFQGGCVQKEKVHIPQEGEIVTWRQNQQLIIKAKLGARRTHIPDQFDREFHPPKTEHYVGQFPIDYVPEKFAKISEQEALALPKPMALQQLEFNLMLNGSTVQATDASPLGPNGIEHPDQVKVFIYNYNFKLQPQPTKNTKQSFELDFMREVDLNSKITQYGLDCYEFKDGSGWKRCFGKSENKMVSGFEFHISPDRNTSILVRSKEPIYGGVEIQWFMNQKNIDQARDIDAAIWRLLETWNVSPFNKISKQQ